MSRVAFGGVPYGDGLGLEPPYEDLPIQFMLMVSGLPLSVKGDPVAGLAVRRGHPALALMPGSPHMALDGRRRPLQLMAGARPMAIKPDPVGSLSLMPGAHRMIVKSDLAMLLILRRDAHPLALEDEAVEFTLMRVPTKLALEGSPIRLLVKGDPVGDLSVREPSIALAVDGNI